MVNKNNGQFFKNIYMHTQALTAVVTHTGGLNKVHSQTQFRWSYYHITISTLCPWAASKTRKASKTEYCSEHEEGTKEPPIAQVQLMGQTGTHIFFMTFPNTFIPHSIPN